MNKYLQTKKEEFDKTIVFFTKEISSLRTGRANPALLAGVQVEAYGVKNPINAVANINVADGGSITVVPFDRNVIKDIEKGITEADLGVSIVNEGDKVRIKVPPMTEENRKELVKKLNEKHEKARISIRQIRDEVKEAIEKAFGEKEVSEDDKFRFIKELDEEVSSLNDELKTIRDKKEEDIMTV